MVKCVCQLRSAWNEAQIHMQQPILNFEFDRRKSRIHLPFLYVYSHQYASHLKPMTNVYMRIIIWKWARKMKTKVQSFFPYFINSWSIKNTFFHSTPIDSNKKHSSVWVKRNGNITKKTVIPYLFLYTKNKLISNFRNRSVYRIWITSVFKKDTHFSFIVLCFI